MPVLLAAAHSLPSALESAANTLKLMTSYLVRKYDPLSSLLLFHCHTTSSNSVETQGQYRASGNESYSRVLGQAQAMLTGA